MDKNGLHLAANLKEPLSCAEPDKLVWSRDETQTILPTLLSLRDGLKNRWVVAPQIDKEVRHTT
jgi:hypothetical protein